MVMLVSLQQASDHVRRDTNADDNDLELKIEAASEAIIAYLGDAADFLESDGDVLADSEGTPVFVPKKVQQATLLLVGLYYSHREPDESSDGEGLPAVVRTLLNLSGRSPTLA